MRAPKLWNNLPNEMSSLDSLLNFKCYVKTYLFKQAFNLQQCICFVYFIIYHLLLFYFIFKSFYLLVNFIHFQSFFLTYCKAHLIMSHGKLRYISFNYYYYYYYYYYKALQNSLRSCILKPRAYNPKFMTTDHQYYWLWLHCFLKWRFREHLVVHVTYQFCHQKTAT